MSPESGNRSRHLSISEDMPRQRNPVRPARPRATRSSAHVSKSCAWVSGFRDAVGYVNLSKASLCIINEDSESYVTHAAERLIRNGTVERITMQDVLAGDGQLRAKTGWQVHVRARLGLMRSASRPRMIACLFGYLAHTIECGS